MIHLKNHNVRGFSFIEMMVALTLLATFGTSLFLVQESIFSKLFQTHRKFINMLELDKHLLKFNQNIQEALVQKKSADSVKFHHSNKQPEFTVDIKLKQITQQSKLFKDFHKNLRLVQATITHENKSDAWYNFMYLPPSEEQQSTQATSTQEPS